MGVRARQAAGGSVLLLGSILLRAAAQNGGAILNAALQHPPPPAYRPERRSSPSAQAPARPLLITARCRRPLDHGEDPAPRGLSPGWRPRPYPRARIASAGGRWSRPAVPPLAAAGCDAAGPQLLVPVPLTRDTAAAGSGNG